MQAGQAGGGEAFAPQANGVTIAAEFGRDLLVGGLISLGSPQDESAAEDEGLRGGACANQGLELLAEFVGQTQGRAKGTRHGRPPCGVGDSDGVRRLILTPRYPSVQILAANL